MESNASLLMRIGQYLLPSIDEMFVGVCQIVFKGIPCEIKNLIAQLQIHINGWYVTLGYVFPKGP